MTVGALLIKSLNNVFLFLFFAKSKHPESLCISLLFALCTAPKPGINANYTARVECGVSVELSTMSQLQKEKSGHREWWK